MKHTNLLFIITLMAGLFHQNLTGQTHSMPKLEYAYAALEPYIDAQTMEIHYSKHHQAYLNNLNKALAGTKAENLPIEELLVAAERRGAAKARLAKGAESRRARRRFDRLVGLRRREGRPKHHGLLGPSAWRNASGRSARAGHRRQRAGLQRRLRDRSDE